MTEKTLLHIVLIKVRPPVQLSFIHTEIEVCSPVMRLCTKANSLTSGNLMISACWCC